MNPKFVDELARLLVSLKNGQLAKSFLKNILTPKEIEEISTRLQIFKLLKKGIPQREIAKRLKVGIGTISRGSRELKYDKTDFNKILK